MLLKGKKPTKEPMVSIGLVLPIDRQKKITLINNLNKKTYKINISKNELFINNKKVDCIEFNDISSDSFYTINPITAGRGFHWQKQISISIHGGLIIKNKEGYLFAKNIIGLESYLMCVATSEMSGNCPTALLEAQTIAARSWMVSSSEQKHINLGIDACNDDCCQRYQGINGLNHRAKKATLSTKGVFLTYNNTICDARYSKSCGGITENNENVWNDNPKPYLRSIYDGNNNKIPNLSNENTLLEWLLNGNNCFCGKGYINSEKLKKYLGLVDDKGDYFRWEITYSMNQFLKIVNNNLNENLDKIISIEIEKRGISGRIIQLKICGVKDNENFEINLMNEYDIRRVFHQKFLYSSAFTINANSGVKSNEDNITLTGAGWGHGVGLCQIGALGMALSGIGHKEILSHYFTSSKILKLYD